MSTPREKIEKLIRDGVHVGPKSNGAGTGGPNKSETPGNIKLTWAQDIDGDTIYERQLITGVYDRVGKGVIFGPSGAGKSSFTVSQACDIAAGRPWNGRPTLPGIVVIVAAEAAEGTRRRVKAYCVHTGVALSSLNLAILERPLTFGVDAVDELIEALRVVSIGRSKPIRLVVIDTLASNEPGREDSEHFGRVFGALSLIARELDCMALVVHHTGKMVEAGARGHSSLTAAMDTVVEIADNGGERTATIVKQRDGGAGEAFAFSLLPVGIGFRETDNPNFRELVTACAVEYQGAAAPRRKPTREGHQTRALDALRVDQQEHHRRRWTFKEASEVIAAYHAKVVGAREPLHRNTPRKTIEALGKAGHVLIDGGFITLEGT